jgi:hypothetical protein
MEALVRAVANGLVVQGGGDWQDYNRNWTLAKDAIKIMMDMGLKVLTTRDLKDTPELQPFVTTGQLVYRPFGTECAFPLPPPSLCPQSTTLPSVDSYENTRNEAARTRITTCRHCWAACECGLGGVKHSENFKWCHDIEMLLFSCA